MRSLRRSDKRIRRVKTIGRKRQMRPREGDKERKWCSKEVRGPKGFQREQF